jgi:hypothetical protein
VHTDSEAASAGVEIITCERSLSARVELTLRV